MSKENMNFKPTVIFRITLKKYKKMKNEKERKKIFKKEN